MENSDCGIGVGNRGCGCCCCGFWVFWVRDSGRLCFLSRPVVLIGRGSDTRLGGQFLDSSSCCAVVSAAAGTDCTPAALVCGLETATDCADKVTFAAGLVGPLSPAGATSSGRTPAGSESSWSAPEFAFAWTQHRCMWQACSPRQMWPTLPRLQFACWYCKTGTQQHWSRSFIARVTNKKSMHTDHCTQHH